jgi:excisionase family DNA binding protein
MLDLFDDHEFLPVDECAERLGVSEDRVRQLVRSGALRTTYLWGQLMVEPAIVTGATPPT